MLLHLLSKVTSAALWVLAGAVLAACANSAPAVPVRPNQDRPAQVQAGLPTELAQLPTGQCGWFLFDKAHPPALIAFVSQTRAFVWVDGQAIAARPADGADTFDLGADKLALTLERGLSAVVNLQRGDGLGQTQSAKTQTKLQAVLSLMKSDGTVLVMPLIGSANCQAAAPTR